MPKQTSEQRKIVQAAAESQHDSVKDGARDVAAFVWDGWVVTIVVLAFLAIGLNLLSAVMPSGLIQILYPLFALGVCVWFIFGENIVGWLRSRLAKIRKP